MKQVRQGVFETNSSSTHSVSVATTDVLMDTLYVNRDGAVQIEGREFGWEVEDYCDANTKAAYIAQQLFQHGGYSEHPVKDSSIPVDARIAIFEKVIKDQTGCDKIEYVNIKPKVGEESYGWSDGSYIDHQSAGVGMELFNDPEQLRMFIFNKHSFLHTDNDNH